MTYRTGRWAAIAAASLTLVACAQSGTPDNFVSVEPSRATLGQANQQAAQSRIAVSHSFTLRLPSDAVESVQQRDLAECRKLGCTVLTTNLDRSDAGRLNARSSVRVAPEAYAGFVAIITAPPAQVVAHSERAEDKTIPLLDVEKRLDAKQVLRDRLTAMLRDPAPKTVADLVAIEKELAQVQGDIETAIAERDHLRTLTDTIRVDISYQGRPAVVAGFDLSPIRDSISGSGRTVVSSIAWLISFLVAAAPWLPVIAVLIWATRRGLRRWRAPRPAA